MKGFGGGMGNMQNLLKQAKQMQEQMAKVQQDLEEMEIEGSSGSGMVKVTVSGKKILKSVKLDKKIVDPEDVELLEDLIIAAFNEALEEAEAKEEEMMAPFAALGGGMF